MTESRFQLARRFGAKLFAFRRRALSPALIYAATARCKCGAGLAYRNGDTAWDCSDILRGVAIPSGQPGSVMHSDRFPFVFYEIKGENQPSAEGRTTRQRVTPLATVAELEAAMGPGFTEGVSAELRAERERGESA